MVVAVTSSGLEVTTHPLWGPPHLPPYNGLSNGPFLYLDSMGVMDFEDDISPRYPGCGPGTRAPPSGTHGPHVRIWNQFPNMVVAVTSSGLEVTTHPPWGGERPPPGWETPTPVGDPIFFRGMILE